MTGSDRDRFEFRLSDSERDRLISDELRRYARTASASELVKRLLFAFFTGDLAEFGRPDGQAAQIVTDDPRETAAVNKLLGVTFTKLRE